RGREARGVHDRAGVPHVRRQAAASGEPVGAAPRQEHRRCRGPAGDGRAAVLREYPAARERPHGRGPGPRDRPADPQGGERSPPLPQQCRPGIPPPRPLRGLPLGRGGATHPAGHPNREPARRRALHPGRALDRAAPARQRAIACDPEGAPRHRQHGARGRARRGDHPLGRPRRGPGPPRRPARRRGRHRGPGQSRARPRGLPHRPLPAGRAADPGPTTTPHARPGTQARGHRRPPAQPARPHRGVSAGPVRRGYGPGRFSFNVKGGRCEACQGDGLVKVEMHFLPDVYVPCEVCKGRRYNRETLEVRYKGKSIADVLDMSVAEALDFFENQPRIRTKLELLNDVGLGYIHLGQSATTLSGGEAQRVKLATELAKRDTGRTLYILDEPTTGLHFEDVRLLLEVLHRLVDKGNTVVVIEHNLDVVKTADWVIDLGPEGGAAGGAVLAVGRPEDVARVKGSFTGHYLRKVLAVGD